MQEWVSDTADIMKRMRDTVETLDASWEGSNHDEFKESFASRKDAVKAKALTIEKFSDSLAQASRLYMELESEVADTVGSL
jgi:uncharacterized protein YukE